jgi:hypothetical protein
MGIRWDQANQPVLSKIQRSENHNIITITIIHIPIPCIYQTLHVPHVLELPELEDGDSDERLEGAPGIWFLMCLQNRLIFDIKIASASFSSFSDLNMLNPLKIVKQCLATAGRLGGLEETQIRSQLGFLLPVGSFPLFFGIT